MKKTDLPEQLHELEVSRVDHRPIVRAYMQRLGVAAVVNETVPNEMDVDLGLIVCGMIVDTFSGRSPLYRLEEFFSSEDTELSLGKKVEPRTFADHNVGRAMDHIYEAGPARVFSELSRRAAILYDLDLSCGHWDSTSVSVWGDYDVYGETDAEDHRLRIVYGHSKDHRPDLKQFLIETLCVEGNIPILGDVADGNASDKTLNNKLLTRIGKVLAKQGVGESAFTYVADSAMVKKENLACFAPSESQAPLYFVTRLPSSYAEADRVVAEAVQADRWEKIGQVAQSPSRPNRPTASYRSYETEVELYDTTYRAVVIHSDAHDKRRQKRIDRELAASRQALEAELKACGARSFFCRADAEAELARLVGTVSLYHKLTGAVEERVKYAPGRPRKDGTRRVKSRHYVVTGKIVEHEEASARKRSEAGCFVLLSNRPKSGPDGQTGEELLRSYKGQDGVEQNFRFLKDPLIVNDLFLKKPERVEVLGMVLLTCLLIWNLMQRTMRARLAARPGAKVAGWDGKETDRPTTFMMLTKFVGVMVIALSGDRVVKPALSPIQRSYLDALDLSEEIFIDPRPPP